MDEGTAACASRLGEVVTFAHFGALASVKSLPRNHGCWPTTTPPLEAFEKNAFPTTTILPKPETFSKNSNNNNNNNGNNNASNCVARHTQIALEAIISSAPRSSEADLLLFTIQFAFPSGLGQQQKQQNLHFVWPGTDKSHFRVIFPRRHAHPKRICCYLQYNLHFRAYNDNKMTPDSVR